MSTWKRAFLYTVRKKVKTVILFLLLLAMSTFTLTGLSIYKAAENSASSLRQSIGGSIRFPSPFCALLSGGTLNLYFGHTDSFSQSAIFIIESVIAIFTPPVRFSAHTNQYLKVYFQTFSLYIDIDKQRY